MRPPFPRSLTGQMLCVLLLALFASHIIGITIYTLDRNRAVTFTEAHDFADRVAGLVKLVGRLPVKWREDIVRGSDGRTLHAMLGSASDMVDRDMNKDLSREVHRYLLNQFPDWTPDRVVIGVSGTPYFSQEKVFVNQAIQEPDTILNVRSARQKYEYLHVSVKFEEGEWLNFVGAIRKGELLRIGPAAVYILSVVVGVAAFAIWLVLRVTIPFAEFARAADRLGKDIAAEPLSESGPTEVTNAANAFNAMQARLQHMIQNRAQMLAAVSHDLRTPVTLLRLRAEALAEGDERTKLLRTLGDMESMIGSVLEFTRATTLDEPRRPVELSALVGSICDDMADTGAAVEYSPPSKIVYPCHRMSLKRALTNLIENAVKYGDVARVTIESEGDTVDIIIDDDGPGIPLKEHEQVFTPFYRIDPSRNPETGGVGLGLSIAQIIINGHGGRIMLMNRNGGGLRVRVSLPA